MDELLEQVRERLGALGVGISIADDDDIAWTGVRTRRAQLKRGRNQQTYLAAYGDKVPLASALPAHGNEPVLAIARNVGPKTADAYRRAEIQYVDASGNAWLQFGDVLIDVQGRRPATPRRNRVTGDLFTTSRAQVAGVLLAWPGLWRSTQREVAHAAGVSLGQANNALRLLAEAGFGPGGRRGDDELLRLWAATFPTGLAERLTLATFRGDPERIGPVGAQAIYRSGEVAAADLLRPATATLYVEELDPRLAVVNRWRTDAEPNIVVRRAFWHSPGSEEEPTPTKALRAPWPLVYADLLASEDSRVRGVAEEWRKTHA
jgi:hypothetical protein